MKSAYNKEYYKNNRDQWYEYQDCEVCGSRYNKSSKYNHFKSKKHQKCLELNKKREEEDLNRIKENDQKLIEMEKKIHTMINELNCLLNVVK